jgi:hypothetical protein
MSYTFESTCSMGDKHDFTSPGLSMCTDLGKGYNPQWSLVRKDVSLQLSCSVSLTSEGSQSKS